MMGWALLDDGFYEHRKVINLLLDPSVDGKSALAMWPIGLSWACRHTVSSAPDEQGVIPHHMIVSWDRMFGGVVKDAEVLCDAGLWDRMPNDDYRIHDFRDWAQLDKREAKRHAGRVSAHKRWGTALPGMEDESVTDDVSNTPSNSESNRPSNSGMGSQKSVSNLTKTKTKTKERQTLSSADAAEFDKFWAVYPKRHGKIAAQKAWAKAVKVATPSAIIAGAERYAAHRQGEDPQYTKDPGPWLNAGKWDDELEDRRKEVFPW